MQGREAEIVLEDQRRGREADAEPEEATQRPTVDVQRPEGPVCLTQRAREAAQSLRGLTERVLGRHRGQEG